MQITSFSGQTIQPKSVTFKANESDKKREVYIDRSTAVRAGSGAFIGNILTSMLVVPPIVSRVLGNPASIEALKAVPPLRIAAAFAAAFVASLTGGYIGAKVIANRGKVDQERLSDKTIFKLAAASTVGTTAGTMLGNSVAKRLGQGVAGFLAQVVTPVLTNDVAVNMFANKHNAKAFKPTVQVIKTENGPIVVRDFRDFLTKTQS